MSGPLALTWGCQGRVLETFAGHVRISYTLMARFPVGAIKGGPHPFTHLVTPLTEKHFEPKLLELKLSLPLASLKSKPPRRDLSLL
jgi:hypothetical protein